MAERASRGALAGASPRSPVGTRRVFPADFVWHGNGSERRWLMRAGVAFALAIPFIAVAATGCRRDDEEQRRANERAEHIAQETTITSGELTRDSADAAVDDELREQAASLAAFRREQLATKARVQKELEALDGAKSRSPRRATRKSDLDAIDRATEQDWPALRQRIEKDVNPAPRVVPRSERLGAQPPMEER